MTTNNDKKESVSDKESVSFRAQVIADQKGSDANTGEQLYQVEMRLEPQGSLKGGTLLMEYTRSEYKALKDEQLSGDDDTVEVTL